MSSSSPAAPVVFIDTETGGTDPARHSLLTIGLVTLSGGEPTRPLHLRLRHERYEVDPEAMAVNGIELEAHHAGALPPEEVVRQVRDYAAGAGRVLLGGHNFGFDLGFLRPLLPDLFRLFRRGPLDTKVIAQFLIHAGLLPRRASTTLHGLAGHLGIEFAAHDALEDARATALVYQRMLELARQGGGSG